MGFLDKTNITNHIGNSFDIIVSGEHVVYTEHNGNSYSDANYLPFMTQNYSDFSGSNALVAGLGLGVIPKWLDDKGVQVDVVEKNSELISVISSYKYLSSNVVLINDDIFTHQPLASNYDIIIFDIWFDAYDGAQEDKVTLTDKYTQYSNNLQFPYL